MLKTILTSSALALLLGGSAQADAPRAFDVAEDHTRIVMAAAPVHANGDPAHGNAFVSQGYIYPAGTLEAETAGVLADGRPAFPDLVLGTWTCDGYFVGDGAQAETGVWVISRQVFAFDDGDTIITQGTEIVDTGVENLRAVTGATGAYAAYEGAMVQTLLGISEQMTVNVAFRLEEDAARYVPNGRDEDDDVEWDSGVPVDPISNTLSDPSS